MSRTIWFYFDYESPSAYLVWAHLPKLAEKHDCTIDALPVLYAGLLDGLGQLGPGEVPAKGAWMMTNVLRKAALLRLQLSPPPFFLFNPLLALRLSLLPLEAEHGARAHRCAVQGREVRALHVSEPVVVERVANELGLPERPLIKQAQSPEIYRVLCAWRQWLGRRSQRARVSWEKMRRLLERYPLPQPRIRASSIT